MFKIKKRQPLTKYLPTKEAAFLYDFAKGLDYLKLTEIKFKKGKIRLKFSKTLKNLLSQIVANPYLLEGPIFKDVRITNLTEVRTSEGKRPINIKNPFASSFAALLLSLYNSNWLEEQIELAPEFEKLPEVVANFFKEVGFDDSKYSLVSFTQLAFFLSREHFGQNRNPYLEELLNQEEIRKILPVAEGRILYKADFDFALKNLKNRIKSID